MQKKRKSVTSQPVNYDRFLKGVRLLTIALDNVACNIERERYWKGLDKRDGMVRSIDSAYSAAQIERKHFDVIGRLSLKITDERSSAAVLNVSCQFVAHFHSEGVNQRTAQRFADSEAKLIFWPYFRQIVSDTTGRMYIPPVIIPLTLDA